MPFEIIRQDITKMKVDAIVNSTSNIPLVGGGVDQKIHEVAGPELLKERSLFGFIEDGHAIITKGYHLQAKYVIHVAGPVYIDGFHQEHDMLYQTYIGALMLAKENHIESIAFPLISSGTYAFPRGEALDLALSAIKSFLEQEEMMIYLCVYDEASYQVSKERLISVKSYIDSNILFETTINYSHEIFDRFEYAPSKAVSKKDRSLSDVLDQLDETFAESLFRLIDEKGFDDISVYKRANIDRKLFSKIKSNLNYQPSKQTVIAFAVALELSLDETKDILAKAGYALSPSQPSDLIIQYFIEREIYDLYEINRTLFAFDQKTIGGID